MYLHDNTAQWTSWSLAFLLWKFTEHLLGISHSSTVIQGNLVLSGSFSPYIGENPHDIGSGNDFLDVTPKVLTKANVDNLDYIKM